MQGGAMGNLKSAIFNGERRDLRDLALNEKKFRELISKKLGKRRASGQTGRSVARGETLDMASYGRYTGRQAYALSLARERFKENVENIRSKQVSSRRQLFSSVAFNPVPTIAPNPPELRSTGMVMANAMLGAVGSLASGFGGQDVGAPSLGGEDYSSFSSAFDVNYDFDSFSGFGGAGTFSSFDMNVNSFPDFSSGSFTDVPIYDIPF